MQQVGYSKLSTWKTYFKTAIRLWSLASITFNLKQGELNCSIVKKQHEDTLLLKRIWIMTIPLKCLRLKHDFNSWSFLPDLSQNDGRKSGLKEKVPGLSPCHHPVGGRDQGPELLLMPQTLTGSDYPRIHGLEMTSNWSRSSMAKLDFVKGLVFPPTFWFSLKIFARPCDNWQVTLFFQFCVKW